MKKKLRKKIIEEETLPNYDQIRNLGVSFDISLEDMNMLIDAYNDDPIEFFDNICDLEDSRQANFVRTYFNW